MALALLVPATASAHPVHSSKDRLPCEHSALSNNHRHGLADFERELGGSQNKLRHLRHCARTPHKRELMREMAKEARQEETVGSISPPGAAWLAALRQCESGGSYSINTGNGFYGGYQFTLSTWQSVGGSGYPHLASPQEQDYRAAVLYRTGGPGHWPNCP